jgi:hypothetical protein
MWFNPPGSCEVGRHRAVSDADWNQLITLASGYLALESGDIQAAMQRALSAHMDLIAALKSGQISAEIPEGTVTMFVPDEGGVALRLEPANAPDPAEPPALPGSAPDAAGAADDGGITEVAAPPQLDVEQPGPTPLETHLAEGPTERGDALDGRSTFTFEEDEA